MSRKDVLTFIALGFGFGYCCGVLFYKKEVDKLHDKLINTNLEWSKLFEKRVRDGLSEVRV